MLRANELRIGNYVKYSNNEVCVVTCIFETHFNARFKHGVETNSFQDNIKPIPLTEEWLLKCGFEATGINQYKLEVSKGWCYILLESDNSFCIYDSEEDYEIGNYPCFDIELKYLHQLQNLYFSLTGEELKIKE